MKSVVFFVTLLISALSLSVDANAAWRGYTVDDVNMRSGPGVRYRIKAVIPAGESVYVSTCRRSWCNVTWHRKTGWVSRRYLSVRRAYYDYYDEPYYDDPIYIDRIYIDRPHRYYKKRKYKKRYKKKKYKKRYKKRKIEKRYKKRPRRVIKKKVRKRIKRYNRSRDYKRDRNYRKKYRSRSRSKKRCFKRYCP